MFPDGRVPEIRHEANLHVRESYDPWVHRVILQSLQDDQIVLDIGAGNMALDDPCIIRMDVMQSPHVDLVADAHYLPFLSESLDYILSLAVIEHLRNPFQAADAMYEVLKDGGYIYHECNFVFAYHGYPHHYFNASMQGMEQIFARFVPLRQGVAPYQMPSFALDMVLRSYLSHSRAEEFEHGRGLTSIIHQLLGRNLTEYDAYFSEESSLNVAAGTYFAGMKRARPGASVIPRLLHELWEKHTDLQERYPNINQLTTIENIMIWAKQEGRSQFQEIAEWMDGIKPFDKWATGEEWDRPEIRSMPFIEPRYGAIGLDPEVSMKVHAKALGDQIQEPRKGGPWRFLEFPVQGLRILRSEGLRAFLRAVYRYIQ